MHRQFLRLNPLFNLLDCGLLPVKVIFDGLLLKVFLSKHIQELVIRNQSDTVFIHKRVDLFFDRNTEVAYLSHAPVEFSKRNHVILVDVKFVKSITILHTLDS